MFPKPVNRNDSAALDHAEGGGYVRTVSKLSILPPPLYLPMNFIRSLVLLSLIALVACVPQITSHGMEVAESTAGGLGPSPLETAGLEASLPSQLDAILREAIREEATPGAALAVGRKGILVHVEGYGRVDWEEGAPGVTDSTLYDLASLTKVIATTTAAMLLEERGQLDLDRRVVDYIPAFRGPENEAVTVDMLLTHRSGMTTRMLYREARGRTEYLELIRSYPLEAPPGTLTRYSDWNMITMQLVIEAVAGMPLDQFLAEHVYEPLGMHDTGFAPDIAMRTRVAPTELQEWRGGQVHGEVHDENAWALGGVAGHAGLFSSARDLAVFAQMMLNGGEYGGVRILKPSTVARWTARQRRESSRALGWDTPSPNSSAGRHFSPRSFGHTGFTGTSIWIDPERNLFLVLLTNRVNPTRDNQKIVPLRRAVADAVQEAVADAPLIDWEARERSGDARLDSLYSGWP